MESLLQERSSVRDFSEDALTRNEVGQLLWAACGATHRDRFVHRTVPSAGALYPLEIYLVEQQGIALYDQETHALRRVREGDLRQDLAVAALGQEWMADAPMILVIAAEPARTTRKYGERGHRFVIMESGFAGQNVLLQAEALGLGATPVGAFRDEEISQLLALPEGWEPLLLVPVGRPARQ